MKPANKSTLLVKGTAVAVFSHQADDFISLTDIAKHKEPDRADQVIQNWMRNRNTVEFLGIWESLNNPDFKPLEFEGFGNRAAEGNIRDQGRYSTFGAANGEKRQNPPLTRWYQLVTSLREPVQ